MLLDRCSTVQYGLIKALERKSAAQLLPASTSSAIGAGRGEARFFDTPTHLAAPIPIAIFVRSLRSDSSDVKELSHANQKARKKASEQQRPAFKNAFSAKTSDLNIDASASIVIREGTIYSHAELTCTSGIGFVLKTTRRGDGRSTQPEGLMSLT